MTTTTRGHAPAAPATRSDAQQRRGGKFLAFRLGNEEFGIHILKVREIIGIMGITAVPRMPAYMKGVVNLRGKVVPVIDLRLKFGMPEAEHTEQTCIIVVDVGREIGVIVDTVSEVLDIQDQNVEPPPTIGDPRQTRFIRGMGKVGEAVKILLDLDQVMNTAEITRILQDAERGQPAEEP